MRFVIAVWGMMSCANGAQQTATASTTEPITIEASSATTSKSAEDVEHEVEPFPAGKWRVSSVRSLELPLHHESGMLAGAMLLAGALERSGDELVIDLIGGGAARLTPTRVRDGWHIDAGSGRLERGTLALLDADTLALTLDGFEVHFERGGNAPGALCFSADMRRVSQRSRCAEGETNLPARAPDP
jgi:hypothetical protein